jgi:glutamine synthetase
VSTEHLDVISRAISEHGIHTVEVGAADSYGHLRGKRVPATRFLDSAARGGVNIADAIYVFDIQCEIVDSPLINMDSGFLDMHLTPDLSTFRVLTHRPGYAIVLCDAVDEEGHPHPLDPRAALRRQVQRLAALGYHAVTATELESYICTVDGNGVWQPFQAHVQYSSLTDALGMEQMVAAMRHALAGAGIPLESSNPEYGPGQLEINCGPADPLRTADNTVLYKSIVKQVAVQHGARATFMPKPWSGQSGSGMHLHSSLAAAAGGANAFAEATREPSALMASWTAGLLANATAMQLIGVPLPNGYRRVRPFTFCPTHVHWGTDNRSVMARLTLGQGSANRVEFRSPGADANVYTALAALLAAGCDGLERSLALPPRADGDQYSNPGDAPALPSTMDAALAAFEGSALAAMLGDQFSENVAVLARNEHALAADHLGDDPDEVTAWERQRYLEHT